MTAKTPREVVTAFFAEVDAGNAEAAFARLSPDAKFELIAPPPHGGVYTREEHGRFFANVFAPAMAAPLRVKVVGMTCEGERVAVETVSTCMNTKGVAYNNRYHTLVIVRDGLIVEMKEYLDSAHMVEFLDV